MHSKGAKKALYDARTRFSLGASGQARYFSQKNLIFFNIALTIASAGSNLPL